MALTPEQVQTIRSSVPILQEHGNAITTSFYATLLKEAPALHNVFNHNNQANGHQAATLESALVAYASYIDDLGALSPAIEKICHKHASLYVRPERYELVGQYLLRAMGDVLGSALTIDILNAWGAAYSQLADLMIQREEQLLDSANGWVDWRDFRISDKVKESEEITSLYLEPVDGQRLPSFLPGQYVSIQTNVPQLQLLQSRQFSLSDAPHPAYYRISVRKNHCGCISKILHEETAIGDVLKVSYPHGEFFLDRQQDKDSPIVLLSAGVGLTPVISILNSLTMHDSERYISFIHGSRDSASRAFHSHVRKKALRHPNIKHITFLTAPDADHDTQGRCYNYAGRLDLGKLDSTSELLLGHKQTQYFLCGPNDFITDVTRGLEGMGVELSRIKSEMFGAGLP